MTSDTGSPTLVFRCPVELDGLLPQPVSASSCLPDWLRTMPQQAFSQFSAEQDDTVKRCPPFIDAMTSGWQIPLVCDVRVEDGEFTWNMDLPACSSLDFARSPVGVHDPAQVTGTPLFEPDQYLIKFHNLWTIEAPPGYGILFNHPFNRFDLPFTTLTGWVDCDRFSDICINFPALWRDPTFTGVLPRGTPIAQCIAVRREDWSMRTEPFSQAGTERSRELQSAIRRERGVYRRQFRA